MDGGPRGPLVLLGSLGGGGGVREEDNEPESTGHSRCVKERLERETEKKMYIIPL